MLFSEWNKKYILTSLMYSVPHYIALLAFIIRWIIFPIVTIVSLTTGTVVPAVGSMIFFEIIGTISLFIYLIEAIIGNVMLFKSNLHKETKIALFFESVLVPGMSLIHLKYSRKYPH